MMTQVDNHVTKDNYLELLIGKIQMESEIKDMTLQKIENNKLYYINEDDEKIIFEQYKNMIRKTSDSKGHQPIVMGIDHVLFSEKNRIVKMEVATLEGETYSYFLFNE